VLQQPPAGHRTGGHADPDGRPPHAEGAGALAPVGEGVADHRERGGEDQRREDAHHDADGHQRAGAVDQRGDHAAGGEAREADEQGRSPAVAVRQAARRQHQRGEGEVVAVDDPEQVAGVRAELGGQARQRDVDDRRVEVDGQDRDAHGHQEGVAAGHGELRVGRGRCGRCQHE
jgi:hypothetical protein